MTTTLHRPRRPIRMPDLPSLRQLRVPAVFRRGRHAPAITLGHAAGTGLTWLLVAAVVAAALVAYGLVDNRWYKVVAIEGQSMSPTFEPGDAIVITRPPEVLEPGMVVTMEVDGQVVTHRVVGASADGRPLTQGDANTVVDDWDGNDVRVVGVQRLHLPLLGGWLKGLESMVTSGAWFTDSATLSGTAGCGDGCAPGEDAPPE